MIALYLSLLDTEQEQTLFEQLYYGHRKLVKHIAFKITNNDVLAEDAVQETMIKIARYIKRFEGLNFEQSAALISVIAKTTAINFMVKEGRQSRVVATGEIFSVDKIDSEDELLGAIAALPTELREPLMLKYYYGFSGQETAVILHISHAALRKRLQRAKESLRDYLEER